MSRFRSHKTAALLAFLAFHKQHQHGREVLIDLFWPESTLAAGRLSLSVALSSLRRQLEPPGTLAGTVIAANRHHVGLNGQVVSTDVAEYEAAVRLARAASTHPFREQQRAWEQALAGYHHRLLPGFYDEWIVGEQERLAQSYGEAVHTLVGLCEKTDNFASAIPYARRAVQWEPFREQGHADLMRLLAGAGQTDDALHHYHERVRLLQTESSQSHSSALQELARQIKTASESVPAAQTLFAAPAAAASAAPVLPPPDDMPPTRSASAERVSACSLPVSLTRFLGREPELADLTVLLRDAQIRLITITGPGGVGKTRLVLEAAAAHLSGSRFERVAFVPLADLTDAALILPAVLHALLVPAAPEWSPLHQTVHVLAEIPTLLILDNYEHLVETGAQQVIDLLQRVPELVVLTTSRRLLNLDGEHELVLPPLPTPNKPESVMGLLQFPAAQLFLNRAQATRPDFQVTERNAETLSALCARLEGLPLALELAAAWAHTLTPAQMLGRLEERRLDLLQSRRRNIAPRHQTMRATLDVSFRLLSPDLASAWLRLSLFRGGWTLDAAQAVFPNAEKALPCMAALREASLVTTEEHPDGMRFRMLETLREYAAEQLGDQEARDAARAHALYFTNLAEEAEPEMNGPRMAWWLSRLEAEADNFRAALAWASRLENDPLMGLRLATALCPFWEARGVYGLFAEGSRWAKTCRAVCSNAPLLLRARAALALARLIVGDCSHKGGHGREAYSRESVRLFREAHDPAGTIRALTQQVGALQELGKFSAISALLEEAQALYHHVGPLEQADILALQAEFHRGRHLEVALSFARQSLSLYRQCGNEVRVAAMLCHLGCWLCWHGNLDEAAPLLEEAVAMNRRRASQPSLSHALWGLGTVAKERGDLDYAVVLLKESLHLALEMGQATSHIRWELADVLCRRGDWKEAKSLLLENLRLRSEPNGLDHWYVSRLARVAQSEGQWERAARLCGIADALIDKGHPPVPALPPPEAVVPNDPLLHDLRPHLRPHLRPAALEAAWKAGRALCPDAAFVEVLR